MGWVAASPWGCARRRGSPREPRALGAALLLSGDRDGAKGTGTWGSLERGPPRWEQVPAVRSVAPPGDAPCLPLAFPRAHRRCFFPLFLPKFMHAQGSREPARTSLELGLFWLSIACSIKHASGSTRPRHRSLSLLFHTPPVSQAVLAALLTELAPCPLQPWQSRRAPRGVLGVPVSPPLRCTASPPSLLDPSRRCGSNPWARMRATWRITPQEKPTAWPPRCPLGATQLLPGGLLGGLPAQKQGLRASHGAKSTLQRVQTPGVNPTPAP